MIKQLPAFPAAPFYPFRVDQSLRAQFRFDKYGKYNEADGSQIKLSGNAIVEDDYVVTDTDTGVYSFPCEYFGAADFTVEAKVTFIQLGSSAGHYILGQYTDGAAVTDRNSWNFRLTNLGVLVWYERRGTVTLNTPTTVSAQRFVFQLNREYHVVAERVGSTLTLYVDGVAYSTVSTNQPLTVSPDLVASEAHATLYGRCAKRVRDIRIAGRALYHGAVYDNFKRFRSAEPDYVRLMYPVYQKNLNAVVKGSVSQLAEGVKINAANSWLEIPHDPKYAVGTGDFRFEITFTFHGNVSNHSGKTNPILAWRTWAAPGQPSNFEIGWNPNGTGLYISTNPYTKPVATLTYEIPVIGTRYKLVVERTAGVVSLWLNDELINSVSWTNSINVEVNRPIMIGHRYGGSNYSVYWTTLMTIEHCWFGIPTPNA